MLAPATTAAAASASAKASGNQRSNQSDSLSPSDAREELSCSVSWGIRAFAIRRRIYPSEAPPQTVALRAGGPDIIEGCFYGESWIRRPGSDGRPHGRPPPLEGSLGN